MIFSGDYRVPLNVCHIAVFVTASAALCQQPDQVPTAPSFGTTTRLIQVNVVALDKKGNPVIDLKKEDFQLLDNGRPQNIAHFLFERASPARLNTPGRNEFSNQFTAANSARSGYSLILIDWLNSALYARIVSQQQVLKLLKQVELNDLVAVCTLSQGLRVLHDFTADRAELIKKISAAYIALRDTPASPTSLSESEIAFLSADEMAVAHMNRFTATQRVLETLRAFDQIASYLGSVPGRKSVIWVTSGFPSAMGYDKTKDEPPGLDAWTRPMQTERRTFSAEIETAVRRLNDADIAVYPVDARGLLAGKGGRINIAVMTEVASRTGGRAFYDRNDIDTAMRIALDDSRTSYTLGYYPTEGSNDGKYHTLRVSVRRPGVELHYRTGYQAGVSNTGKTPEEELQQLLGSQLDATVIPIRAHAERMGDKLDMQVRVDPTTLLREQSDRRVGKISIFFSWRPEDAAGRVKITSVSGNFDLTRQQYQELAARGMTFRKQLPVPSSATSLRVVVRDEGSGAMGSVTIPLSAVQ